MFEAQPIQLPRDEREEDDEGDEGDEEKEPKMVEGDLELARQVFQKGYKDLKSKGLKNEVSCTHPPFWREGRKKNYGI
jgi:crooked neck